MEERDRSRSPSRRTSRVEQVVGRWLRRSRESSSRERILVDGKTAAGESSGQDQKNYPVRLTVQISRDQQLNSHGLTLSPQTPVLVQDVTPEGPADGRLVPGDQVVKINNVAVEDLTPEQAADLIRECPDCVTITVLRNSVGPKSSFITPEKRAKLRSNPVKVHFAEEVEVNGHSQGNSLLFLPNVLKVYLENGQTKAFKFEPNTTVKDIVMTLKEKLSLCRIEHFSLVLEQKYSIAKLLLLHEEERIQQVVQKKEVHDYRCLFRVCFMPREPQHLLQNDPTAFEYLYLQGINDVLQERFAVEMRCNTALRLAALHIQERLASCGQSPKTNLKIITKSWGIENFVSSTLLRNMREKDLRKAIGYHMKKSQSQEPKQKVLSANQARINYLQELCELKSFGGKSFSATMMLQDRESMVTLLVGSRYGISQVVNHKLSIMSTLTEFSSITRIELLPESDRVSLVKIYLQDIKPITLMLESVAAKELSCLIAGYCRALVDPSLVIFPWVQNAKQHRVSTEEGYVSRCGSDSDDSSDIDTLISLVSHNSKRTSSDPVGLRRIMEERKEERKERKEREEKKRRENERKEKGEGEQEKHVKYRTMSPPRKKRENERIEKSEVGGVDQRQKNRGTLEDNRERENANEEATGQEENKGGVGEREEEDLGGTTEELPSLSETSDSCRTDSRFMTSVSSDSLDALEEDDLIACSSSLPHSHTHPPFRLTVQPPHPQPQPRRGASSTQEAGGRRGGEGFGAGYRSGSGGGTLPDPLLSPVNPDPVNTEQLTPVVDPSENMNYAELSLMLEYLPSPPEASDDEDDEDEERRKREGVNSGSGRPRSSSSSSRLDCVFTFDQSDTRCYYNICTSVTPDSAHTPNLSPPHANTEAAEVVGAEGEPRAVLNLEPVPILQPPPGFGDSSSDEEFFDARDRFASPEDPTSGAVPRDFSAEMTSGLMERTVSPSDVRVSLAEGEGEDEKEGRDGDVSEGGRGGRDMFSRLSRKRSKKRRSFMETDFTSTVSYPGPDQNQGWKVDQYPDQFQSWMESPDDTQLLSLDPQSSEQSGNPCLTVSSLSHAEGEACQLESKPILPKPSQDGPGDPRAPGNPEAELRRSSRSRRQSMETEPDVMESKSVTALVTAASHAITAVRRRVGPDGKESTDRRGDGEEGEAEGEEKVGEGERGGVGTGPFTSHMFLTETKHVEGDRGEKTKGEGGEKLPSPISEGPPTGNRSRFNRRPLCITKEEEGKASFVPQICVSPPGVYGRDIGPEDNVTLTPPSSLLPSPPAPSIPHMVRGEGSSENGDSGPRPKPSPTSDPENHYSCLTQAHRKLTISHEDLTGVGKDIEPNATSGKDSVTDNSYVATPNICDVMANNKATVSTDCLLATANRKDPTSVQSVTANTIANTNMDVVTANLDLAAANNDTNASVYSTMANSDVSTSVYSAMANSDANASINSAIPSVHITGTSVLANIPKESPASPTTGVLQSCSPGIIGQSLSASTLRGKIQSLPLFLSRSQERALSSRSPSPKPTSDKAALNGTTKIETARKDDVTVEDSNDSLEAPAESEESEVTPTELELGDVVVETAGAEITRLRVSEVKEVVEKVVMVYGSSPPPSTSVCLDSEPDPKMAANLPSRPIPEAETTPPMASAPLCLGPASDHEPLSTGSIGPKMALPLHSCPSAPPCPSGPPCSSAPPCPSAPPCSSAPPCPSAPVPIRVGPKPDQEPLSLGYKMTNLSSSCPSALVRTTHSLDPLTVTSGPTISTEPKQDPHPEPLTPVPKMSTMLPSCSSALVVTTQSLNGPRLSFPGRNIVGQSFEGNRPPGEEPGLLNSLTTGCGVFTATAHEARSELAPTQLGSSPPAKPDFGCTSVLASGCKEVLEGVQTPLEVCGCPPPLVYTNCFSGGDSFDDELTVYEFSCRASSPPASQTSSSALALPLMTSPPLSSFLPSSPPSSFLSPSFPCSVLPPFSSPELSPLLSPLLSPSDCFLSQSRLQDDIGRLRHRRYPAPPTGFQAIRSDVDELLTLLQEGRLGGRGGRHPRETCATHFTENKRLLHGEARRLMAGCQKVVRVGQTPDEMLLSLADSFRTLVGMAGVCLWFSGCDRCDRRNADALAGLADVARTYREFAVAAERASGRRSCHDLSTKLLAKQCTALTASVFCLTQLFRTLTAL